MASRNRDTTSQDTPISPLLLEEMRLARRQFRLSVRFSYKRLATWLGGVLIFSAVSAAALIFAFGYKYNPAARAFERTSVIELNGVQVEFGVDVYLNGEKLGGQLPMRLSGLEPRTYTVRVVREGAKTFEETVTLHENERLRVEGIILPLERPAFTPYTEADANSLLLPSRADRRGITIKNGNELWFNDEFILRTSADITDARHFGYRDHIAFVDGNNVMTVDPGNHLQQTILALPVGSDQVAYDRYLQRIYVRSGNQTLTATVFEHTPAIYRFLPVTEEASPLGR